jgi:predicted nucleic acid-binding protein
VTLIVDASVVLKWVLPEDGTDRARALVMQDTLAAPDLLWIECANVLWVKARRGQIAMDDARSALEAIRATPIVVLPVVELAAPALEIAAALDHSAYDSLYLAAALQENCVLVTADLPFAAKASSIERFAGAVRPL